jgi:hypothetical protein
MIERQNKRKQSTLDIHNLNYLNAEEMDII